MATYTIRSGHILTVVTDALTKAAYFRIGDPDNSKSGLTSIDASTTAIIGPFTNDQRYDITTTGGRGITIADSFEDLSTIDALNQRADDLADLTGVQTDFLGDLADDADGEAIAAFANAIRDALVNAGIMAEDA